MIVKEANSYRPAEISTGQEMNGYTEVLSGVAMDESIVVSGQFLIDSEASLSGVLARLSHQDKSMPMDSRMTEMNKAEMPAIPKAKDSALAMKKAPTGRGKVVEVNLKLGKVTLDHEPINALGWPSMIMGFKVSDSNQLSQIKAGDEVEFDLKALPADKPNMPTQYEIERVEKITAKKENEMGTKP